MNADRIPMVVPTIEADLLGNVRPEIGFLIEQLEVSHSLVDFPVATVSVSERNAWLVLKLRNVGSGPALMKADNRGVALKFPGSGQFKAGSASASVVAAGDQVLVVVASHSDDTDADAEFHGWLGRAERSCKLIVRYSDIEREVGYETAMDVGIQRPNPVVAVDWYALAPPP